MHGERDGTQTGDSGASGVWLPERIPTGVAGLDEILHGGLLRGGSYLLVGGPGTGKTVLANQICFAHARSGGRCIYVTLLTETHVRMIGNLSTLGFFEHEFIGDRIWYVSGTGELRERGLDGLYALIDSELRRRRATMLVLDGIGLGPGLSGAPEHEMRSFLNHLTALLELHQCTAVLSALAGVGGTAIESSLADGLLELTLDRAGMRAARELFVRKLRGSHTLEGSHLFEIGQEGVVFYPRAESRLARATRVPRDMGERLAFGVDRLDQMLHGGLMAGSTTSLLGAPGSGKTLLGLHFLAEGARRGEPALYLGLYESPARIVAEGEGAGLPLQQLTSSGALELVWSPPFESLLDRLVDHLLTRIQQRGIRRLFVDGVEGLTCTALYPARMPSLLAALTNELRALGVTTLMSVETRMFGVPASPATTPSAIFENIILLRYVELRSQLYRFLSILKLRGSSFDSSLREFTIGDQGVRVADTFESAEAILSGMARTTWPANEDPGAGGQEGQE